MKAFKMIFGWFRVVFFWFLGIDWRKKGVFNGSVCIIIPAYNEAENIARTVKSLISQMKPGWRILVVDDCSSDGTGDIARSMGVEVLRTEVNQGNKASALKYALNFVTEEVFIIIDADTVIDQGAVDKLLCHFADKKVGSACGLPIPIETKTIFERCRLVEYLSAPFFKGGQSSLGTVMVASGCFAAFRTSLVVTEIGGITTGIMAEDMYMTWQMLNHGYDVVFEENAICRTMEPKTFKVLKGQLSRWYRGFFQCLKKTVFGEGFSRKRLLAFVLFYYVLGPVLVVKFGLTVFNALTSEMILNAIAVIVFWEIGMAFLLSLKKAWQLGMVFKMIIAIPAYLVLRHFNTFMFFLSFYQEMTGKLEKWEKGH